MANTEGISDEAVQARLAALSDANDAPTSSSWSSSGTHGRGRGRRLAMMDQFEDGMVPAARVVKASPRRPPPTVAASRKGVGGGGDKQKVERVSPIKQTLRTAKETDEVEENVQEETEVPRPVILSERIVEKRPTAPARDTLVSSTRPVSKFRRNLLEKRATAPASGFPSLDVPVGRFARNGGRGDATAANEESKSTTARKTPAMTRTNVTKTTEHSDADAMFQAMTDEEKRESMQELQAQLPPEMLQFLRQRAKKKQHQTQGVLVDEKVARGDVPAHQKDLQKPDNGDNAAKEKSTTTVGEEEKEGKKVATSTAQHWNRNQKEQMAQILSSVRTFDDMDAAYREALQKGLVDDEEANDADKTDDAWGTAQGKDAKEVAQQFLLAQKDHNDNQQDTLELTSSLLRSTSTRQRFMAAKILCELLETANHVSLPHSLSVSLRCLLDIPSPPRNHQRLQSYVWRCLYALVWRYVHAEHRVAVRFLRHDKTTFLSECSPLTAYPLYFMEDFIPSSCPVDQMYQRQEKAESEDAPPHQQPMMYATTTAETDQHGKAFVSDPLWTLSATMRILPRMADILAMQAFHQSKLVADGREKDRMTLMDAESLISICGILSIMSLRSMGLAAVIGNHARLLPSIVSLALQQQQQQEEDLQQDSDDVTPMTALLTRCNVALAALILLTTLARQSQAVASREDVYEEVMPTLVAILGIPASNELEWLMQRWSLILWRTLLRYGLAMNHVSFFLNVGASHVSVSLSAQYSLAAEFTTAFATFCDSCILSIAAGDHAFVIPGLRWFFPHARQGMTLILSQKDDEDDVTSVRVMTARLRLLSSYLRLVKESTTTSDDNVSKDNNSQESLDEKGGAVDIPMSDCVELLEALATRTERMIQRVLLSVTIAPLGNDDLEREAAECAFVEAVVILIEAVLDSCAPNEDGAPPFLSVANRLSQTALSALSEMTSHGSEAGTVMPLRGWLNAAHFALFKLMLLTAQGPSVPLRSFAAVLFGRLMIGEEALAAAILLQGIFTSGRGGGAPLETAMLHDMTKLPGALKHSLLWNERRLKSSTRTAIQALVSSSSSTCSSSDPKQFPLSLQACGTSSAPDTSGSSLLPMGNLWIWNVLSSTVRSPSQENGDGDEEKGNESVGSVVNDAVTASLGILIEFENAGPEQLSYCRDVDDGTKLYHLSNACLYPESVLQANSQFARLFETLFGLCTERSGRDANLVRAFISACYRHTKKGAAAAAAMKENTESSSSEKTKILNGHDENRHSLEERKLFQSVFHDTAQNKNDKGADPTTPEERIALTDFVDDLCTSFLEHGAQYDVFVHVMRFFFHATFPAKTRCDVLTRLGSLLHLLTLNGDEWSKVSFQRALERSLAGGLFLAGSKKDPSELLNCLVEVAEVNQRLSHPKEGGFVHAYIVGCLARDVAIVLNGQGSLSVVQRRLSKMSWSRMRNEIVAVAERCLGHDTSCEKLVQDILDICQGNNVAEEEDWWKRALDKLQEERNPGQNS